MDKLDRISSLLEDLSESGRRHLSYVSGDTEYVLNTRDRYPSTAKRLSRDAARIIAKSLIDELEPIIEELKEIAHPLPDIEAK